jgi:hypothetical protein
VLSILVGVGNNRIPRCDDEDKGFLAEKWLREGTRDIDWEGL